MTLAQIVLILPLILVTATAVFTMLAIAAKRVHGISCLLTVVGLSSALVSVILTAPATPEQVTPLLIVDSFSVYFSALILLCAIAISIISYPYLSNLEDHQDEFYLLISIAVLGALVMVSSNHFITAFLGMETLSVCLYGMVAYPLHRSVAAQYPLEASIKYLVLSAVSSGFVLFGVAMLYAQTGTLGFISLVDGLVLSPGNGPGAEYYSVAALLVIAGFAFKLSLVPFHLWTPDVYEGAPLPATAFLATIGKAAMLALLLRYINAAGVLDSTAVVTVLTLLAAASILIGNLLALLQENLKRLLAYSSIAHMGYVLIALLAVDSAASGLGSEASAFYLTAYVFMTLGAFVVMTLVSDSAQERDQVDHYTGLFWRSPGLAMSFTTLLLSLAGIPLTIGFIGKFYVFAAGVEQGLWGLLAMLVIGSGIGLYYYLRIIYRMLQPAETEAFPLPEIGLRDLLPLGVLASLVLTVIMLGIMPGALMSLLESVARVL